MDLYSQQVWNRRKTGAFIVAFVMLVALMGLTFELISPFTMTYGEHEYILPVYTLLAVVLGAGGSAAAYYKGDRLVLAAMHAKAVDEAPKDPKHKQLRNVVEEMAIAAGIPMPAIYTLPDPDLNAFATGRSPDFASIAITDGLLEALDREELQAVVAHEMAHIRNLDIRTMLIVSALLGIILVLAEFVRPVLRMRGGNRKSGGLQGPLMVVALLLAIIAPIIARLMAMAVSRTREYEADRTAAELTRNPLALARALRKLEDAEAPTLRASQGTAHMFIIDPRAVGAVAKKKSFRVTRWWASLFATHPEVESRIARLEAMGYGA
jgi:heat shock protein HtpX